jgi:uncharacterized protein YndB with AHSA1/START domain
MRSFLVKTAIIELEVGGKYELHFSDESPWGQRGSEGCRVLTYLPMRLLSFTWNAPPQFEKERFMHTRVIVELEPVGDSQTNVKLTHLGFGTDGQWNEVHQYFERAWGFVLEALAEHFDKK